jgi:hypothetical protein
LDLDIFRAKKTNKPLVVKFGNEVVGGILFSYGTKECEFRGIHKSLPFFLFSRMVPKEYQRYLQISHLLIEEVKKKGREIGCPGIFVMPLPSMFKILSEEGFTKQGLYSDFWYYTYDLPEELRKEYVRLDKKQDELKQEWDREENRIIYDDNISDDVKKRLLKRLKEEYKVKDEVIANESKLISERFGVRLINPKMISEYMKNLDKLKSKIEK